MASPHDTCKHLKKASPNFKISQYAQCNSNRSVWLILDHPATMLHYSHTADHRVRSYTDRSMPERNLVGDLLRLHPSPGPVDCRSIDNEPDTVFPYSRPRYPPRRPILALPFSRGMLRVWLRWRVESRFDRSIDRRITKPCPSSALCGHVCTPRRGGFPDQWSGGHLDDSADTERSIDLERDRRGSLLVPGPRSDRGHRTSTTAAEILNPLAASERVSRRTSDRERAYSICEHTCLLHYMWDTCVSCACTPNVRVHAGSRARSAGEGRYFVPLWMTDKKIPVSCGSSAEYRMPTDYFSRFG